jgi:hypothetical protein
VAFVDDLGSVSLVLGFTGEGKCVLGLAIWNFVDPKMSDESQLLQGHTKNLIPEPFVRSPDQARLMPLDILNVIKLGSERIRDVDDDDFPVCFALVQESHDAEDFDLLDLTDVANLLSNLADVEGIVVTLCLGLGMRLGWIFPSLVAHLACATA